MALLVMEGFDNKIPLTLRGWSANVSTYSTGRIGTGFAGAFSATSNYLLPSTYGTAVMGVAWNYNSGASAAAREIARFRTAAGVLIASVVFNQNFAALTTISLLDNTGATVYTSPAIFSPSTWYQFELKITVSGGVWELRANGAVLSSGSGATFGATNIGSVQLGTGTTMALDDFYVCDTSGAVNNDFLGDARISTFFPTGDGALAQFTPSTGSNHFANVDDVPPNDDTDYNSDSTVGHIDTFTHGSLPASTTVKAVQHSLYARKDDVALRQIAPVIRRGGTNNVGTTVTLSTTYANYRELRELDPITAAAWVDTNFNSDEFGVKVIA